MTIEAESTPRPLLFFNSPADAMYRFSRIAIVVLTVAFTGGVATTVRADNGDLLAEMEGTYRTAESLKTLQERIDREIEQVAGEMYFFKRPFARNRLEDATEPCTTIEIKDKGEKVWIQCDDRKPAVSPADGTTVDYEDEGETVDLSQEVAEGRIRQSFKSEKGGRTNIYRLVGDDTLSLTVTIDGEPLPEAVEYSRAFERQ